MSRLDDLPPDQRAVLSLLVRQGKSHAEIAELLGIPRQSVSDRANAALDTLADEPSSSGDSTRQQPPRAGGSQPSVAGGTTPPTARAGSASPPPAASSVSALRTQSSSAGSSAAPPTSRRGGALLLAALVVIVVVVVVLITSGGGSNKASSTQASSTTASTATHSTTPSATKTSGASSTAKHGAKPTVDKQIALTSPEAGSKSIGLVEVVSEGSKHAIYIAAEHLPQPPAGSFYAVWLSNSPTSSTPLGRTPAVGADGRLQAGTLLPANAGDYQKILLTRETDTKAAQPGPTVLSGAFSLGH